MRTRARLVAGLVGLVAALTTLTAAPADAHAYLQGSNPADGANLSASPATLRLSFSEHVVLEATHLDLVDGDGHRVPVTGLHLVTAKPGDIEEPAQLVARLPHLEPNSYRLAWETLSSDDLHRTAGIVVFGVGRPAAAERVRVVESAPRSEEAALRWLLFLGVGLALGGALARRCCARLPALAPVAGSTRLVSKVGAVGAAAVAVALLAVQLAPGDVDPGRLLSGGYGARWAVREAGLLALVAAAFADQRARAGIRRALLLAGAALTGVGSALLGHAGAGARLDVTRVLATGAHLVATLTWVGAVVCLALVAGAAHRSRAALTVEVRAALRAFGLPAAACVSVAVVTGVYLASSVVGSVDAALRTLYGRTLLLKLLLVGAAGLLALVNHLRLRGRHDLEVPRRTVRAEAGVALLVVAATGLLVSGQPATQPGLVDRPAAATHGFVDRQVGDLQESLSLRPNRPGRNVAVVDVFDTRRPSPGPVTGVDVGLADGASVPAVFVADGHWTAALTDLAAGPTTVTVTVHRAGLPDTSSGYAWAVGGGSPTLPAWVSTAPLRSTLRWLAGGLAVALAAGWAVALLVRSRRAHRPPGPPRRHRQPPEPRQARRRRHSGVGAGVAVLVAVLGAGSQAHSPSSPVTARIQSGSPAAPAGPAAPTAPTALEPAPAPPISVLAAPAVAVVGGPVDVPKILYAAYRSAVEASPTSCHLRLSLLAAIGTVESGSLDARSVDARHRTRVLGPMLDGNGFKTIADTDNGKWDGSRTWDRAVGPMQFLPSTWRLYGRDGDHDGVADPQDIEDAAAAAGAYLCSGGRDLAVPDQLRAAVLMYNHSRAYLRLVLTLMDRFETTGLRPAAVDSVDVALASLAYPVLEATADPARRQAGARARLVAVRSGHGGHVAGGRAPGKTPAPTGTLSAAPGSPGPTPGPASGGSTSGSTPDGSSSGGSTSGGSTPGGPTPDPAPGQPTSCPTQDPSAPADPAPSPGADPTGGPATGDPSQSSSEAPSAPAGASTDPSQSADPGGQPPAGDPSGCPAASDPVPGAEPTPAPGGTGGSG